MSLRRCVLFLDVGGFCGGLSLLSFYGRFGKNKMIGSSGELQRLQRMLRTWLVRVAKWVSRREKLDSLRVDGVLLN